MRGPFELLADFYDYHYSYYRFYLHRRLTFSDYSWEQFHKDLSFNIFRNKDDENVGALIKQTTWLGFASGLAIAPVKFILMREYNKIPIKKCIPVSAGIVVVGAGIGLIYGTVVNASARMRGKDGAGNHVIASLLSIPATGVYARQNKLQWGVVNAITFAALVGFIKLAATGKVVPGRAIDHEYKPTQVHFSATHWKP